MYNIRREQNPSCQLLNLHLMYISNSYEYFTFINNIQKENIAFERMINDVKNKKVQITIPEPFETEKKIIQSNQNLDGKLLDCTDVYTDTWYIRKQVIGIDMREFWSQLPHYLYDAGFWLVPIQLTVGDYIISDEIAIERKSVSTGDLQSSISSGRLLEQVKNMCKYFKKPALLIEFDNSIPFRLKDKDYEALKEDDTAPCSIFTKL